MNKITEKVNLQKKSEHKAMLKERSEEELRKLVLCELHATDGLLDLVDKVKKTIWTNQT